MSAAAQQQTPAPAQTTQQQNPPTTQPTPPTQPKAPAAKQQFLYVEDTNCHHVHAPTRIHDHIVEGRPKSFTFKAGEKLKLPPEEALRFLRDPSFIITTEKGAQLVAPPMIEDGAEIRLKPDECVAKLTELETKALVLRAKQLTGGEAVTLSTPREAIIEFLMRPRIARLPRATRPNDVEEDDRGTAGYATIGGSMGKGELEKLFAGTDEDE